MDLAVLPAGFTDEEKRLSDIPGLSQLPRCLGDFRVFPALQARVQGGSSGSQEFSGYLGFQRFVLEKGENSVSLEFNNLISHEFEEDLTKYSASLLFVPEFPNFNLLPFLPEKWKLSIREPDYETSEFLPGIRPILGIADDVRLFGNDSEEIRDVRAIGEVQLFFLNPAKLFLGQRRNMLVLETGVEKELRAEWRTFWDAKAAFYVFFFEERVAIHASVEREFKPEQETLVSIGLGFKL